jgi:hypothetical protein
MTAIWARFRSEVPRRWQAWLALAALVGIGGGAVLGVLAGARRTGSAYDRFVAGSSPADYLVASGYFALGRPIDLATVARLPGVRATTLASFLPALGRTSSGRSFLPFDVASGAPADAGFGRTVDRWKMLAGRRADPHRLDEAVPSFEFARQFHVQVGDTVRLRFITAATATHRLPQFLAGLPDRLAGQSGALDLAQSRATCNVRSISSR